MWRAHSAAGETGLTSLCVARGRHPSCCDRPSYIPCLHFGCQNISPHVADHFGSMPHLITDRGRLLGGMQSASAEADVCMFLYSFVLVDWERIDVE